MTWPNWGEVALTAQYPEYRTRTAVVKTWGPDMANSGLEWIVLGRERFAPQGDPDGHTGIDRLYDPTNGTLSSGDIGRIAGETHGLAYQL